MNFIVDWLSFYLVEQPESDTSNKRVTMSKLLSHDDYQSSELKDFLDGEFTKIAKRKVEATPKSDGSPTKIGQFIIEQGHPIDSNPTYGIFQRLLHAVGQEAIQTATSELLHMYLRTSQVRGGVLLLVKARLDKYDDHFLFILKCDFEQKTAVITDEKSLISNVNMAINAKNMKSIMFPHLLEPGMTDNFHVKIHQFSHARYFEEFLKYIEYPETVHDVMSREVLSLARQHIEQIYPEPSEEREREEEEIERIAASPKRELSEKWEHETVMEAAQWFAEQQPDIELKLKLDHIQIRALLADYGDKVHIAKANGRYLILLEGDMIQFEKGCSPVEFLKPKELHEVLHDLERRSTSERQFVPQQEDAPPW
ncbi:DUF3900 domain-containing protein [Brevibacillus sp. SYSU BS000544]|uniref:DUF3900 domain-containing protein n=1 Tax=Brevibacillus sp. SYSU BS000544 TaxID=3416443 RepID=UPI003CE4FA4B